MCLYSGTDMLNIAGLCVWLLGYVGLFIIYCLLIKLKWKKELTIQSDLFRQSYSMAFYLCNKGGGSQKTVLQSLAHMHIIFQCSTEAY